MSQFLSASWALAGPSALILFLLVAGAALSWSKWHGSGRLLSLAGTVCLFAITFLPLDSWALRPLETRFPPPDLPPRVEGVIVLGGSFDDSVRDADGLPSLNESAERMTNFVRLSRLYPNAKLVFSGGTRTPRAGADEADAVRKLLGDLGVDLKRVMFEETSRNTYENAVFSKRLVVPRDGEIWVLITSAAHMPRAVGVFRKTGWTVLPLPVGYKAANRYTVNMAQHLKRLDDAIHEWTGLLAYRLEGRTNELFPDPGDKPA